MTSDTFEESVKSDVSSSICNRGSVLAPSDLSSSICNKGSVRCYSYISFGFAFFQIGDLSVRCQVSKMSDVSSNTDKSVTNLR